MIYIFIYMLFSLFYQGYGQLTSGRIRSPDFPNNYPNNINYTWIILAPQHTNEIELLFKTFQIYQGRGKCDDYLKIVEAHNPSKDFSLFKRCGIIKSDQVLVARDYKLVLTFVTDNVHNAKGFDIEWRVKSFKSRRKLPPSTKLASQTKTTTPTTTKTKPTTTVKTTAKTKASTSRSSSTTKVTTPPKTTTPKRKMSDTPKYTSTDFNLSDPSKTSQENNLTEDWTTADKPTSEYETTKYLNTTDKTSSENNLTEDWTITGVIIGGICVVEVTMIVVGIIFYRQRKPRSNDKMHVTRRRTYEENRHTDSPSQLQQRKTIGSEGHLYEDIPFDQRNDYEMLKVDIQENPYVECADNVYEKAFKKRPHTETQECNTYESITPLFIYELAQRNVK